MFRYRKKKKRKKIRRRWNRPLCGWYLAPPSCWLAHRSMAGVASTPIAFHRKCCRTWATVGNIVSSKPRLAITFYSFIFTRSCCCCCCCCASQKCSSFLDNNYYFFAFALAKVWRTCQAHCSSIIEFRHDYTLWLIHKVRNQKAQTSEVMLERLCVSSWKSVLNNANEFNIIDNFCNIDIDWLKNMFRLTA